MVLLELFGRDMRKKTFSSQLLHVTETGADRSDECAFMETLPKYSALFSWLSEESIRKLHGGSLSLGAEIKLSRKTCMEQFFQSKYDCLFYWDLP